MSEDSQSSPTWKREHRRGRVNRLNRTPRRGRVAEPEVSVVPIPAKETATAKKSDNNVVIDFKLALLLLFAVFFFFWVFSVYFPNNSVVQGIEVSRGEFDQLISKQRAELQDFISRSEQKLQAGKESVMAKVLEIQSKSAGEMAGDVKKRLGEHVQELAQKQEMLRKRISEEIDAAREKLKALLEAQMRKQREADRAELRKALNSELGPMVSAEIEAVEKKLQTVINVHVKELEVKITNMPGSPLKDNKKKDYAFQVVEDGTSETYKDFSKMSKYAIKVLGFSATHPVGPDSVTAPFQDNRCWAFAGNKGQLTLKLREPTKIGSIGMQHTREDLSFFNDQVPKNFEVFAFDKEGDKKSLGKFENDLKMDFQVFKAVSNFETEKVAIEFSSNFGSEEFTCVSKVTVHA